MRSLRKTTPALILLGALSAAAHAGQTFSFQNPFASSGSTYANGMFESTGVYTGFVVSSLESRYTGTVNLTITDYSNTGVFLATNTYNGVTYELTDSFGEPVLIGSNVSSGAYTVEGGTLTFFSGSDVFLSIDFDGGTQTNGGFGADVANGQTVSFSGSKVTTNQTQNAKFGFGFPAPLFANPQVPSDPVRYTAGYTSSIGTIETVPEPASMAALAVGGLALLRRRRRA